MSSGGNPSCAAGGSAAGEDCEGEEQEEPSSSLLDLNVQDLEINEPTQQPVSKNNQEKVSVEDALTSFRVKWQQEIGSPDKKAVKKQQAASPDRKHSEDELLESEEERAKALFLKGVEHEQTGKLYEAIQFYKRAVQLIPDIEFRLYESTKMKSKGRDESPQPTPVKSQASETPNNRLEEDEDLNDGNLLVKIEKIVLKSGCVCLPEYETKAGHMSSLPLELMLYILRWVVSGELDLQSLERCAAVCRGFYLCARDQEIWRLACVKTWGMNCGTLKAYGFLSWRQMFIERARLRFNGCYISKTTYLRHGENSYQDQFYRPWYLIEYYRYLRFFPDGVVLMLTTADEPQLCCTYLKQRLSRAQGVLSGHYRLHGDKVILVVKKPAPINQNKQFQPSNTRFRPRRKDNSQQDSNLGQRFHLELQIQSQKSRKFCSLQWCGYTVFNKHANGSESSSTFDIVRSKYPPFWFSRVKSYHAEAESPLQ